MIAEAQTTIRNVSLLLAQRGLLVAGNLIFAALVPRLMGPGNYGRYALVTSLAIWFGLLSNLGLTQVMGRYVPEFILQGEKEKLKKFFNHLLVVSLMSGGLLAGAFLFFALLWLKDLDALLLTAMAVTVFLRTWAHPFFSLFLGLNQAARWGMSDIFRRWVSLFFLLPGFYLGGLLGACLAFLLAEFGVVAVGIWWGRSYLSWSEMGVDIDYLIPYLRFGFVFFIGSLLAAAFQNSGEVLIRFYHKDYDQVAYFNLAYNVYLTVSVAIPQFALAFAPLMTTLLAEGKTEALRQSAEHLLKWLTVGGVWVVFGVLLLGNDLVPLVLGVAYKPVAANLLPLSMMLLMQALSGVATVLTLVLDRPRIALTAATIRLAAFWGFGIPLVASLGSLGGCVAALLASMLCAGYFIFGIQKLISFSLRRWAWEIGLAALFLPLGWLRLGWVVNLTLYLVFLIGYCSLLLLSGIITLPEIAAVGRAIRLRAPSQVRSN